MSDPADRLFDLLPAHHRALDGANGPLRQLLAAAAAELGRVEADLGRWYRNWFVETCEGWVVPYLGDLLGVAPVIPAADVSRLDPGAVRRLRGAASPRADVADTIRRRRRKGTLRALEELAFALTGRPGVAVEFRHLVSQAPDVRGARPPAGRRVSLRDGDALDHLGGPFDAAARTADVRGLGSGRTPGRFAARAVGLFVFPWVVHPVTHAPALGVAGDAGRRFTLDALGRDGPLFNHPPRPGRGEAAAPVPIRPRAFAANPGRYYGPGRAVRLWWRPAGGGGRWEEVPRGKVVVGDLSGWELPPELGKHRLVLDPRLGRAAVAPRAPERELLASYAAGFGDHLGGGEYPRDVVEPATADVYRVVPRGRRALREYPDLAAALRAYRRDVRPGGGGAAHAVIEIGVRGESVLPACGVRVPAGRSLQLRARPGVRALVRATEHAGRRHFTGGRGSVLTLDGLAVYGSRVRVGGAFELVRVRHCTLSPCEVPPPRCPAPDARTFGVAWHLAGRTARVEIDRSVLGPCEVVRDAARRDPLELVVRDTVWDAGATGAAVLAADCGGFAHARLTAARVTALGPVVCHAASAENAVFDAPLRVARRQEGCLRFCYLPPAPDSRPPRLYQCVHDPAPLFESRRPGDPGYARLADDAPAAVRRGAEDFGEMGAFHDLFWPQRLAALQARVEAFVPVGTAAAVLPAHPGPAADRQRTPR